MFLKSVTISGFRCFGPTPISVDLSESITALVGPNAAGKTALLQGLTKLFGISHTQRRIQKSDFHLGPDDNPDDRNPKELFIDVLIALPELNAKTATPEAVAPSFRHMQMKHDANYPVCRLRLEARWEDDGTAEGEVLQTTFWIYNLDSDPADDKKHPIAIADRGLIQLYYTPANRSAALLTGTTTSTLITRLLRAIEWSEAAQNDVTEASENLANTFSDSTAIVMINKALQGRWSYLHDEIVDTKPRFSLVSRRFEEIVRKSAVIFEQSPNGHERGLDALSDGQQSLFYFAIAAAVSDLERQVVEEKAPGFHNDQLRIPALSIFAFEEPENHLSPYYLARIIHQVQSFTATNNAQSIVTSHSPAILSRVNPRGVRYCRLDSTFRTSSVTPIKIPKDDTEASKFVRGAMHAYPELYFARFVLFVEGDSERIILPHLAKALDLLIDPAFVAIVPLGGRHVQYFWQLLLDLGIPYATLLDLDLGRAGGGFGRVKTAIKKLIDIEMLNLDLLNIRGNALSAEDLDKMHTWQDVEDLESLAEWIDFLKQYGVFFSMPLDFDLAMLKSFPDAYEATIPPRGGPRVTDNAADAVFGTAGPGHELYSGEFNNYIDLLPDYRYHFLTRSKPTTHSVALADINLEVLRKNMPPVLNEVLQHVIENLRQD